MYKPVLRASSRVIPTFEFVIKDPDVTGSDERGMRKLEKFKEQNLQLERLHLPYPYSYSLALYLDILNVNVREEIKQYIAPLFLMNLSTASCFMYLKQLSQYMKENGKHASENWTYFINLELLGGYMRVETDEVLLQELNDWLVVDVSKWNIHGDNEQFLREFAYYCAEYINQSGVITDITLDEYIMQPSRYSTSGSSRIKFKTKEHTKWLTSLNMGPEQIRDMLLNDHIYTMDTVALKYELGKVRPVVAGNDETNLRMSFLSYFIEQLLTTSQSSVPDMAEVVLEERYRDITRKMSSGNYIAVSIDQEHFDHNPSKRMIMIALDAIEHKLSSVQCGASAYVHSLMQNIRRRIIDNPVYFRGSKLIHTKGIESGWRWTSLLDTMINYAEQRVVISHVELLGIVVTDLLCQGDDGLIIMRKQNMIDVGATYNSIAQSMGMPINIKKYYTDDYRCEFLRKLFMDGHISGYPCRALPGILWFKPNRDQIVLDSKGKAFEIASNWIQIAQRGISIDNIRSYMLLDLMGSAKLYDREKWLAWLATPACVGGFGILEFNSLHWYRLAELKDEDERYTDDEKLSSELEKGIRAFYGQYLSYSDSLRMLGGIIPKKIQARTGLRFIQCEVVRPTFNRIMRCRFKPQRFITKNVDPMIINFLKRQYVLDNNRKGTIDLHDIFSDASIAIMDRWRQRPRNIRQILVDNKIALGHSIAVSNSQLNMYSKGLMSLIIATNLICHLEFNWLISRWIGVTELLVSQIKGTSVIIGS